MRFPGKGLLEKDMLQGIITDTHLIVSTVDEDDKKFSLLTGKKLVTIDHTLWLDMEQHVEEGRLEAAESLFVAALIAGEVEDWRDET